MEGVLYDQCNTMDLKQEFVKRCLFARRKEQMMKNLDWRDHSEFLKYWDNTYSVEDYKKLKYK